MFEPIARRVAGPVAALAALVSFTGGCTPVAGSPVAASEAEAEEPEPVAVTVFTDQVELFMEYPRLVPGLEARFLAHVTVLATGEPVRSGTLRLQLARSGGEPIVLAAPRPARDGLFIPSGAFQVPGSYAAEIVVDSEQVRDSIPLPPLVVHPDLDAAFAAAEAEAEDEPRDSVPFLLEQQWKIGLLMEQVGRRSLTRRLQVPGEVEVPQHAMAAVGAPLPGRLLPPESGRLPRLGERVETGQVLAFIEPPLSISDAAQLAANAASRGALDVDLLLRELDLRAKALEIEQSLALAQAQLDYAQGALARIEGLRAKDLGTVAELETARRDVELALRAGQGYEALKESLEQARRELDALRERSRATDFGTGSGGPARHALVAPISGHVVQASFVEGEHVDTRSALYRLHDLDRVWITTHVSEFDLAELGPSPGALLTVAAYPARSFDVLDELQGRVIDVGRVVDPETRTVALRFEATNPDGLFRAGMFADVFLETTRAIDAVAVREESIVMDNGRPIAFVLLHGEAFQKRALELGIRDGAWVEVLAGIEPGERVVTRGAYLVKLAAASPASFGEGHAH
jgi:biotin carboxyl carrier protein